MEIESRYPRGAGQGVAVHVIVAGRLQLIHVDDGTPRPLTFERRGTRSPATSLAEPGARSALSK